MCITINQSYKTVGTDNYYSFSSSYVGKLYAEGSWAIGKNGVYFETSQQSYERAVQRIIDYLGGKFNTIYGRPMQRTDICGEEGYKTPEQIQADIAAAVAFAAAEQQRLLNETAQQLQLKSQMLTSDTAVWQSQDTYNMALADTNKAISLFNETIKPAELPIGSGTKEQIEKQVIVLPDIQKYIIGITIIIVVIALLGGKKLW